MATKTLRLAGAIVDSGRVCRAVSDARGEWTAAISSELSYGTIALGGFALFTAMHGYLLATRGQTIAGTKVVASRGYRLQVRNASRVPAL
jgi:hypothetical protein